MKQNQNINLPDKGRPNGLFLYCNKCKNYYSSDKEVKCKCLRLVYKARVHISGTKNATIPKVLKAKSFPEAVTELFNLKEQLQNNGYQKIIIKKPVSVPSRLIECFAYYLGFLNNVGVPPHKQKKRDQKYIDGMELLLDRYQLALTINSVDTTILKFVEVNDDMVGFVHDYFLDTLKFENKTYNNNMSLLSAFTSHIIKKFKFDYDNPFLGIPDRKVNKNIESVRQNEFERLLEIITLENGVVWEKVSTIKNLKKRTVYRSWLKHAYKFGLYTGGRSEDIVEPKWSDIILNDDGKFNTIKVVDHKIDKANSHLTSEKDRYFKHFTITKELGNLLMEMGYEKYKGTDKHIVASEETIQRAHVAVIISKSFSHYYKQLNTGKQVSFRHLRKAFSTSALMQYGDGSLALTNHTNISTINKHYADQEVIRDEAKENFSVFKKNKK